MGAGVGAFVGLTLLARILGATNGPGTSPFPLLLQLLALQAVPRYRQAHCPEATGPFRLKASRTVDTTGREPSFIFRA